jgi:hypothetical protein
MCIEGVEASLQPFYLLVRNKPIYNYCISFLYPYETRGKIIYYVVAGISAALEFKLSPCSECRMLSSG